METMGILDKVKDYKSFYTLKELDERVIGQSNKYGFEFKEVGHSEQGRGIYMISAGKGRRNAFVWGFPHPNEPVGAMSIDFLIDYFGRNKGALRDSGYKWNFIYTADPDGTKLNEGWFKGKLSLRKYFDNFFRPSADCQLDWTFPVKYKDFEWNKPMKETKVLMKIIDEIKPDLMYPLHNSGFGGAYFFSTREFNSEYYENITYICNKFGIPLHMGEPEEDFMRAIKKPFYFDIGFKDYYEEQIKGGNNPKENLEHGENSTNYLLGVNPSAVIIKAEIPAFFDKRVLNMEPSDLTRREAWGIYVKGMDDLYRFYEKVIPKILSKLEKNDPFSHLFRLYQKNAKKGIGFLERLIATPEFERKATNSEVLDCNIALNFYRQGWGLGQLRRAGLKVRLEDNLIKEIDQKLEEAIEDIEEKTNWSVFPIKKMVQLQLAVLFETMKQLK